MVVLARRHRRAVCTAVRRAVGDEAPGAAEEETGPATVCRVPPGLLNALPVHALGPLGIVVVVRDVNSRLLVPTANGVQDGIDLFLGNPS